MPRSSETVHYAEIYLNYVYQFSKHLTTASMVRKETLSDKSEEEIIEYAKKGKDLEKNGKISLAK